MLFDGRFIGVTFSKLKHGEVCHVEVPQGSVLGPLLFILHASEVFDLVDNRLYTYADDSTLLAVVRKPADRPAVATSLNKGLTRIQEWCNHWCMILNPNKIKASVVRDPGL